MLQLVSLLRLVCLLEESCIHSYQGHSRIINSKRGQSVEKLVGPLMNIQWFVRSLVWTVYVQTA